MSKNNRMKETPRGIVIICRSRHCLYRLGGLWSGCIIKRYVAKFRKEKDYQSNNKSNSRYATQDDLS